MKREFPGKSILAGCRHPNRIETGPLRFGDDWAGSFMRGDTAGYFSLVMGRLLDVAEKNKIIDPIEAAQVRNEIQTIADSDERSNRTKTTVVGPLRKEHAVALIGLLLDGKRPAPEVELSIIGALSCFADDETRERLDIRAEEIIESSPETSRDTEGLRYDSVRWHRLHDLGAVKNGIARYGIYGCLGKNVDVVKEKIRASGITIQGLRVMADADGKVVHIECDP